MEIEAQQVKNASPPTQGWLTWAWGGGSSSTNSGSSSGGGGLTGPDGMTDAQRKELYEAIDYDEKDAVTSSLAISRDVIGLQISAQLRTGSLALRSKGLTLPTTTGSVPDGREVMSLVFDGFNADVIQRHDNIEAALTLDGMHVYDGTTPSTLYPDIIRMKGSMGSKAASIGQGVDSPSFSPRSSRRGGSVGDRSASNSDPFFYFKFEHAPLDDRADNAVTVKMKAMEIIYHRGFVEAIYKFLKPPESQLESVGALIVSPALSLVVYII
jgi:vacuolar protein sorting-associated protein 13A/C